MKVSLVKNLFPGMSEDDRGWIQNHPELGVVGCSKTHEGKGCHLVVSLVLCTLAYCLQKSTTLKEGGCKLDFCRTMWMPLVITQTVAKCPPR